MIIDSLNVDENGDSFFTEVDSTHPDDAGRTPDFAIDYWQFWETLPGHFQDFTPVESPCLYTIIRGKMEITSSLGQKRHFVQGEALLVQDTSGKGHAIRTYGLEPCMVVRIVMKKIIPPVTKRPPSKTLQYQVR